MQLLTQLRLSSLAAAALAAILLSACSSSGTPASDCTTAARLQTAIAREVTDRVHAQNSDAIPAGARWPTRTADMESSGSVSGAAWDQTEINSLYWDRQAENEETAILDMPPMCGGDA